jgi:hypothetical protein
MENKSLPDERVCDDTNEGYGDKGLVISSSTHYEMPLNTSWPKS